jgi:hypothetical protein
VRRREDRRVFESGGCRPVSTSIRSLLTERVAWANARLGDAATTKQTLAELEHVFSGQNMDDDPSWAYWLNETEIDLMAGRCLTELKRADRAVELLTRAAPVTAASTSPSTTEHDRSRDRPRRDVPRPDRARPAWCFS